MSNRPASGLGLRAAEGAVGLGVTLPLLAHRGGGISRARLPER